jgi:hypothetical protein
LDFRPGLAHNAVMKLFPLVCFLSLALVAAAPAQMAQQLLSEAQTAYIRGDLETAKKNFTNVLRLEPRNQVAINYLRMIQVQEAKAPKGNDQEKQLAGVLIPKVELREATLGSALDFLRQALTKASGGKVSCNFVVLLPEEQVRTQGVTLSLTNVPFTEVLRYLGTVANINFVYEKYAIRVTPATGAGTASSTATPTAR